MFFLYLKKIFIQGFKSFADKTEIKFNNDITAIIGPNGSGKSNISDAIRWVLGEQSIKNLRGSKMEDVIFSGTDKRRALGFAEVSIVFDNNDQQIPLDYNEVSITRRMFRSGESEFYINKNHCRLKDIRELLMDTGVGKEGYSIIGQGKIDEILSTKPVDRRGIFEEAAGIVKFKNKKMESERKLDKTQNNILRIEDLIYEVESQRDQVEKEANKTERFNKLFVRLKELEVNQFISDINKLEKELEKLNDEKTKLEEQINNLTLNKNSIEDKYSVIKEEIKIKEEVIEESRNVKFAAIQDYEKNKNQLSIITEKKSYLKNEIKRLRNFNIDINENFKTLEESKNNFKINLEMTKNQIEESLSASSSKEKNLMIIKDKINAEEKALEEKKDQLISLYNLISDKRSERNSQKNFLDTIETRIKEIMSDRKEIKVSIEEKQRDLQKFNNELQSSTSILEKDRDKLQQINLSFEKLNDNSKEINDKLNNLKIKLNGLNSSFNLMNNMENDYDGYYNSVKKFMKTLDKNQSLKEGYVGVVADLIQVKDIHVKAIEVALGGSAQNIVVDNESNAKNMIKFLKDNRLGRVTFLPKNTIKGYTLNLNESTKKEFNILGLGNELVSYHNSNDNIIKYLLGRVVIIKDMDSAIRYSKISNYKYKIVTLDGELFNPGGSITGGSLGDNRISILSRKNKLKNLRKEIEDENVNLNNSIILKDEIEKKINREEYAKSELTQNIEKLKINISNLNNEINNSNSNINRLNQEFNRKDNEIKTLESEYKNLLGNQDEVLNSIKELENQENNLKNHIEQKNESLKDEKEKLNHLNKEHTNLIIEVNSLKNEENNLKMKTIDLSRERERLDESLEKNTEEIKSLEIQIDDIEKKYEEIEGYQKKYDEEEKRLSGKLNELISSKDTLMQTFYEEQDNLKIINDRLLTLDKNLNSLNVRIARYEVENQNIYNKLLEEYDLDFNQALKYQKDLSEYKNIKSTIKELKEEIKSLGNVNINALEEFRSINERYEFMSKQYQDLVDSRENLKLVIKDMDKNMKTQFIKEFDIINSNFKKVFSILFDGGFAELELEDEDNILESGIDIKVQPPGKKLQYLNLLSGGEKSLTAVALLFSILMTKPSPFCILDEIDAALDESNINRYIKYLKNFSDTTQFILITHRKTTMEIADVLYGITMEEQGVSKLISVLLKDEIVAS